MKCTHSSLNFKKYFTILSIYGIFFFGLFSCNHSFSNFSLKRIISFRVGKFNGKELNKVEFIHNVDFPNDDFSHIFGYGSISHKLSKLQQISIERIKDVILYKTPIDAVSII